MHTDKWGRGRFDAGPFREDLLAKWINEKKYGTFAELGVFDGYTLMTILANCPTITHAVGVDTWASPETYTCLAPKGEQSRVVYEEADHESNYNLTKSLIAPYEGRYELKRMTTADACKEFEDGYFDVVFIDADHSYEGVKADIIQWKPKVKEGGLLCGHDWSWPGVKRAVLETLDVSKILSFTDDVWVYPL